MEVGEYDRMKYWAFFFLAKTCLTNAMTEHKDVCTQPGVQWSISNGKWTICKYVLILNKHRFVLSI